MTATVLGSARRLARLLLRTWVDGLVYLGGSAATIELLAGGCLPVRPFDDDIVDRREQPRLTPAERAAWKRIVADLRADHRLAAPVIRR